MKIKLSGRIEEIAEGAKLLSANLGCEIAEDGAAITVTKGEKGFRLSVKNSGAEIEYERPIDFFRALSITVDALRRGEIKELSQTYAFDTCGIMIDVSRRAVLKVETVKSILRYMACMGLNRIMLYTEDTYELDGEPYFGYLRGRYRKEELKEIVAYGNLLGIESVPCIQVLAHLERALRWNAFDEVRTAGDTLLVGEEKTYQFIEKMIRTVRECFTSNNLNINMDEAYNASLGKYMERHGYRERLGVVCEHMQRVIEIAKKYNFHVIADGNTFLSKVAKSPDGKTLEREIAGKIPEEVTLYYWSYDGRSEDTYDLRFVQMNQLRRPILFYGAIHTWEGPNINYKITFESTFSALRACKRYGCREVIASMWGDDGCECDVTEALLGWQLFAECNYTGLYLSPEKIKEMFRVCTGFDAESFLMLDNDNYYGSPCPPPVVERYEKNIEKYPVYPISKQALYQNPLFGLVDKNLEQVDLRTHYRNHWEQYQNVKVPAGFETLFAYNGQLLNVLVSKCDVGIRLKKAYDWNDRETLAQLEKELDALTGEIQKLYEVRAKLWYQNNKPFGFEAVGNRLMAVKGYVFMAAERVRAFLNGEVDSLPELEEERLYYNGEEMPFVGEYDAKNLMIP